MPNYEPINHTPNFDIFWQQWLARQTSVLTDESLGATTQAWDAGLDALAAFNTNGILVQSANDTFVGRTLTGTSGEITVTNGSGVSGNPTISLPSSIDFTGKTITNGTFEDPTLSGTVAGSPTVSGVWTFTGSGTPLRTIKISNTFPNLLLTQTDAAADTKTWQISIVSGEFRLSATDDALTGANHAITITRSTTVPDVMDLNVNTLTRKSITVLDRTNVVTITGKSISLATNTLTGTTAQFNTALTDGSFLTDASLGSTVQAWDADLDALAANSTSGFWARTGAGTGAARTMTGTANEITVANGVGDANPTFSLPSALTFTGKTVTGGTFDGVTLSGTIAGTPTLSGEWTWTTTAAGANLVSIVSTESGSVTGPLLSLYRDSSSPAVNDNLGQLTFHGEDSAGNKTVYASIRGLLLDPNDGSEDGDMRFQTIVAGTVGTRAILGQGLHMSGATGGDQGSGTINATAVYDDGVILTDYVPDAYIDGDYSVTDYDSRIPIRRRENGTIEPRQHGPARRFKTNFDELDPVLFANKWKSTRKLPAFNRGPEKKSTGEAIQALIETCEVLAVHLDKHETRIQALE